MSSQGAFPEDATRRRRGRRHRTGIIHSARTASGGTRHPIIQLRGARARVCVDISIFRAAHLCDSARRGGVTSYE